MASIQLMDPYHHIRQHVSWKKTIVIVSLQRDRRDRQTLGQLQSLVQTTNLLHYKKIVVKMKMCERNS